MLETFLSTPVGVALSLAAFLWLPSFILLASNLNHNQFWWARPPFLFVVSMFTGSVIITLFYFNPFQSFGNIVVFLLCILGNYGMNNVIHSLNRNADLTAAEDELVWLKRQLVDIQAACLFFPLLAGLIISLFNYFYKNV